MANDAVRASHSEPRSRDMPRPSTRSRFLAIALIFVSPWIADTNTAVAKPPTVQITEKQQLRFGKFAVPSVGERTVGPDGSVTDTGLLSVGSMNTGPASFVISYDRGNNSKKPIAVTLMFSIQAGSFSSAKLNANLKNLTSDIPGASSIVPGQPVELQFGRCAGRVCSENVKIGATMQVVNSSGGGEIAIPTYVDVVVTEIER